MERSYYRIYRKLYEEYPSHYRDEFFPPDGRFRRHLVWMAVERGLDRSPFADRVRPDAKFALLVNFDELIARPHFIRLREEPGRIEDAPEGLLRLIEQDTVKILTNAAEVRDERSLIREREEVTGGDIFRAIGKIYDELKTTALDQWG